MPPTSHCLPFNHQGGIPPVGNQTLMQPAPNGPLPMLSRDMGGSGFLDTRLQVRILVPRAGVGRPVLARVREDNSPRLLLADYLTLVSVRGMATLSPPPQFPP